MAPNMALNSSSSFLRLHSTCIDSFWHLVCHRSSLPEHGSYLRVQLAHFDLFIHNYHGVLSCYVNRCPHRGSRIVNSLSGKSALQCPYHGWSFQPLGTSVPRSETFAATSDPRQARLEQWYLEDLSGFIFISLNPFLPLSEQIGGDAVGLLERISFSIQNCHSSQIIEYEAPWMIAVENALEPYHVSRVHPETLGSVELDDGSNTFWDWGSVWHACSSSKKIARLSALVSSSVSIAYRESGYTSLYLFPFSMLSSTESLSYALQLYQPSLEVSDGRTSLLTSLYTPSIVNERMRNSVEDFYHSTAEMNKRIFEEDADVSSLVPFDSWSDQPLTYASSLEEKINHFRDCCRKVQALADGPH
jgi:phenylpropionate dioxygenase-like ring-hydroxylating dioxygenase large terminal subunit